MTIDSPTIWVFEEILNTGDVYDETQCDDRYQDGDILVIPSEQVIGILVRAWPTAVTAKIGKFHRISKPGMTWDNIDDGRYQLSAGLAQAEMEKRGWV